MNENSDEKLRINLLERLITLEQVVITLSEQWLNRSGGPMLCEVCKKPATVMVDIFNKRQALCDKDKGNRPAEEDFRAGAVRTLQSFLEKNKREEHYNDF